MSEETYVIKWMAGTTSISHEQRVEGNDLVFGYRLNGGEFKSTCRMVCNDKASLNEVLRAAKGIIPA